MCATCGCSDGSARVDGRSVGAADGVAPEHWQGLEIEHEHDSNRAHDHAHAHGYGHGHGHDQSTSDSATLLLEQRVLAKNDGLARRNLAWFEDAGLLVLNVMSSPGSGKTTLLARTLTEIGPKIAVSVVEGDQETDFDADRLRATGRNVVQINTGAGCHLDAEMVADGVRTLRPVPRSVVFVENVGNLVCPALFGLGEQQRVVVASTTEGEDKPLKYPHMFRAANLVLLNKIDLLPHLRFDVDRFVRNAQLANPAVRVLRVSAETGQGMRAWYDWLSERVDELAANTLT